MSKFSTDQDLATFIWPWFRQYKMRADDPHAYLVGSRISRRRFTRYPPGERKSWIRLKPDFEYMWPDLAARGIDIEGESMSSTCHSLKIFLSLCRSDRTQWSTRCSHYPLSTEDDSDIRWKKMGCFVPESVEKWVIEDTLWSRQTGESWKKARETRHRNDG